MAASKGIIGECGERGGYMEFVGFDADTRAQFTKIAATSLSSGTIGQIFVGLMVTPPPKGAPSHKKFSKEVDAIFGGLQRRAIAATRRLNQIPGVWSAEIEGAMYVARPSPVLHHPRRQCCVLESLCVRLGGMRRYAFPSIYLPEKFITHAGDERSAPDELWCLKLLEATGIVTVAGSGFGQKPGTWHFRMTVRRTHTAV